MHGLRESCARLVGHALACPFSIRCIRSETVADGGNSSPDRRSLASKRPASAYCRLAMTLLNRLIVSVLVGFLVSAMLHAQDQQSPPAGGGRGRGGQGAAGGGRRGLNFPQQTRQLASPDVIARGKAV
jgi:hypothetical protein